MNKYSVKIKNDIEELKINTIHDVYLKAFVYLFVLGTVAIILRSNHETNLWLELTINALGGGSFIVFLYVIKAKVKNFSKRYWIYLIASLMYSIATAIITKDDFLTTSSIGLVVFAVLIFFSFSRVHLLIYIVAVTFIIINYTYVGVNQQVNLTIAYPISAAGSFLILGYILLRGARLFRKYESMLYSQIDELDEKNMELGAYNEEFQATEEQIMAQYDEINQLNKNLNHINAQTEAIVNSTEDAFIGYNPETKSFEFSSNVKKLLKLNDLSIEDNIPVFLKNMDDESRELVRQTWNGILDNKFTSKFIEIKYPIDDTHRDFLLTFLKYTESSNKVQFVVAIKEITHRKESERLKNWKVYHDEMTGLLNRNGFIYEVDQLILNKNLDFYVILFDLDDFKYINTSFGYAIGDQIIIEIGNRLTNCQKNIGHLAHLDGDSYIMTVQNDMGVEEAICKIEEKVGTITIDDIIFNITCSVGIGAVEGALSTTALIRKAELAMYEAKAKGKKQHAFYSDEFNLQVSRRYKIIQALENVIMNEEIYLVYQPKVTSEGNKIIGFESLVRWESEELGFVGPMEFIDLAEKTGQIVDLGYYIMEEAMVFTAEIAERDNNIMVSINISAKQLIEENFIERVAQLIKTTGVDSKNIGFEVTETAYIGNMEAAEDTLKKLSKMGIKIYLDDFGTGYSSLSYLDRLPINCLKIDKSFIDKIHLDNHSKHMLKAILSLSKSLGIECIAEGVELKEQLDILREEGCELIQGYYFDKPLSRSDAIQKLGHTY